MFLRKKAKTAATPNPSPNPNFVSPTRAAESTSNDTPPPLFAKFATQGQSGFGNESRNGEKKPMVSGPMTLVSKRESVAASAGKGMDRAPDTARTRIQSEKPLPPPIVTPEEETQDILSSRPPQSALPINRRASNTPRISSANGADSVPPEGPGVRRITTKPTSPPSRNSSLTQPAQTQAHIASPQSLPARKSSAQDLRRKETKSSYSGHDAQRDNLIPTRPTNNQSYAPVDPPSSYRITSTAAPSSRPPSSFNNGNNNNGPVYSGKNNDSFYTLPQANGSTASAWNNNNNNNNTYTSPNSNSNGYNPYSSYADYSNTNFNNNNMGASHSTAMGPGSGPFPSHAHASASLKGMAAAAPAFNSPPMTFDSGMGMGSDRRTSMNAVSSNMNGNSRKGPLIFAAMTTVDVAMGNQSPTTTTTPMKISNSTRRQSYQVASAYPSPPADYASPGSPAMNNKRFSSFSPPPSSPPPIPNTNNTGTNNSQKRQSRRLSLTQGALAKPQPPLPPSAPAPNSGSSQMPMNANMQTLKDTRRRSVLQKEKEKGVPAPQKQQQYYGNGNANGNGMNGSAKQMSYPAPSHNIHPAAAAAGPSSSSPPPAPSSSSHRTLTKSRPSNQQRPTPPVSPEQAPRSRTSIINASTRKHSPPPAPSTTQNHSPPRPSAGPVITPQEFEHSSRRVAIPMDEDPFARSGGVRMLSPFSQENDVSVGLPLEADSAPASPPARAPREVERPAPTPLQAQQAVPDEKDLPIPQRASPEEGDDSFLLGNTGAGEYVEAGSEENVAVPTPPDLVSETDLLRDLEKDDDDENDSIPDPGIDTDNAATDNASDSTPPPPELRASAPVPAPSASQSYQAARSLRRGDPITKPALSSHPLPIHKTLPLREDRPAEPFPLALFVSEPSLLRALLAFLSYFDWCNLVNVTKEVKEMFFGAAGDDAKGKGKGKGVLGSALKEEVLERFLRTVGYVRWGDGGESEPIVISIRDLHSYMLGVTLPTFEYARIADLVNQQKNILPTLRDPAIAEKAKLMVSATRAYNRVLLRLRAQAERRDIPTLSRQRAPPRSQPGPSRSSSRAPSPTFSVSHVGHGPRSVAHGSNGRELSSQSQSTFRSPLFRVNRAPLLRVFVPSPEGDWLSDASVLECEAELKRSNALKMMRLGDVVWDLAVGEEGNAGRLIWDGSYLIDLDYTYSPIGDLPKYVPGLAFPPSYFHRIIRTGASSSTATSNPIIRIDLSPWGPEVAANLQLLQDRVRTETPQGSYHNVVRWVHRSSFHLRPPRTQSHGRTSVRSGSSASAAQTRIPIPDSPHFVDPGWYGKVVVETEGTNEALADLQDRCGKGAFPPRAGSNVPVNMSAAAKEAKMVYRILRERSRPGEIWIRTVSPKERLI